MRLLLLASVIAVALAGPELVSGANGTIRGRVEIPEALGSTGQRPTVTELGTPPPRQGPDRRQSVVYLETAPSPAFDRRDDLRATLDQRNEEFVPRVLAIRAGTIVDFPNSDRIYHNVFSLSKAQPFDLGRYAAGRSKSVRFDRPGIVRVFCEIHSHMTAYILVFGHPFFSVTDRDGRFRLANVPPGAYAVAVWNEALPTETKQIRVADDGGDVEVNFTIGHER